MNSAKRNGLILISMFALDQLVKLWVEASRPDIDLGFVRLHYVTNTGAGFGILQGNNTLLIFVSLMVLGLIMTNIRSITRKQELPMVLITAGLFGNLFDRVFRGYVVDFIDLGWFPVFNLADSYLSIGIAWMVLIAMTEAPDAKADKKPRGKKQKGRA